MAQPLDEVAAQAMKLPRRARARLAQRLISSLDARADSYTERLWREEAERRLDELKSGKAAGVPADTVVKRARAALR